MTNPQIKKMLITNMQEFDHKGKLTKNEATYLINLIVRENKAKWLQSMSTLPACDQYEICIARWSYLEYIMNN